jgi:hypothetical protein
LDNLSNNNQSEGTFEADYEIWKNPFFGLTKKNREDLLGKIRKQSEIDYENNLKELKCFIKNFDILNMICFFSQYYLTTTAGTHQELTENDPILQFHVELLQALALQMEEEDKKIIPILGADAEKIEELIKKIPISLMYKRITKIDLNDENEHKRLFNIEMFRFHTMSIRNWGYKEQIFRLTRELFEPIDNIIENEIEVSILKLMDMMECLFNHMEFNLNERTKLMQKIYRLSDRNKMLDLFVEYYPFFEKEELLVHSSECSSNEDFANYLVFFLGDQFIKELYTFTLEECLEFYPNKINANILEKILDKWAYEFSELKSFNTDYIFFDNPIWRKPLIKIDKELYCWPIPGNFLSFCIDLMESVIDENGRLKKIYGRRRGKFLENAIENLFNNHFKNAKIYSNLMRKYEDGENDLLAIIDSYALIIEAKSGKVSIPARRGAPDRLKKDINKLIIESSEQSKNFEHFIENNLRITEFTNKKKEIINIDLSQVKHVLRFGVTFDMFGPLASRTPLLFEAGLADNSDISPTMTLVDLEILFDILETDSEKIYYFSRRTNFDKTLLYTADELDLLSFYLKTGFNIGKLESSKMPLELYGESQEVLDAYYLNLHINGKSIPKPRPKRIKWWQDTINTIESRGTSGWSEITSRLLDVSYEDQLKFEKGIKKIKTIVNKEWKDPDHLNQVILLNGPEGHEELIIAYCYKEMDMRNIRKNMKKVASQAIIEYGVGYTIVIGIDIEKGYPYNKIGLFSKRIPYN